MIRIADINVGMMYVGMYHVRKYETDSFGRLDGRSCMNCRGFCTVYSRAACCMSHFANIKKERYL